MSRILLVEDDCEVRLLIEHVLLGAGYEVDTSGTLKGGSELLDNHDYDLVLADGRLRDGTGMMLAKGARKKGVPSLIMTGYAFVLQEIRADPALYHVLLKPISPDELLVAIAEALPVR